MASATDIKVVIDASHLDEVLTKHAINARVIRAASGADEYRGQLVAVLDAFTAYIDTDVLDTLSEVVGAARAFLASEGH